MKKLLKNKKILITGGCGFIGSHIAKTACSLGAKVTIVDNLSSGCLGNIKDIKDKVQFHKVDINDKKGLKKIFKKFDFITHQAALRSVPLSMKFPREFIQTNIEGTLNLLELAASFKVKVFASASSSSVYGDKKTFPEHEDMHAEPVSFYAMTKLSTESICNIYNEYYGVKTVSLRYFNVYGAYQNLESQYAMVIPKFITSFLTNKPCPIFGDGKQSRDFSYIDDVVRANLLSFVKPAAWGRVFNVGGGSPQSVLNIYNSLKRIAGKDVGIRFLPLRVGDVKRTYASMENCRKYLGFIPKVSFKEGIQRTFDWFDENRWFWQKKGK